MKGSSKDWWIERAVALAHLIAAMCGFHIHFEYVDGGANWSDSTSRESDLDPCAHQFGFPLEAVQPNLELYQVTFTKLAQSLKPALGEHI